MKRLVSGLTFLVALVVAMATCALPSRASTAPPHVLVARALDAMGGRSALLGITSIEYVALGERDTVEQPERPTGPYFFDQLRVHEIRDLSARRTRIERTIEGFDGGPWWFQETKPTHQVEIINDDVSVYESPKGQFYANGADVQTNDEQFAFGPERLLLTADAASDLATRPDIVLHGVIHHVLTFTWHGAPCTLYLSAATNLPWRIDYTRSYPYDTFLNSWGDLKTSVTYNAWNMEPGGIIYPREWTYRRANLPDMHQSIVQMHINQTYDTAALAVRQDLFDRYHGHPPLTVDRYPLGMYGSKKPYELAPGIFSHPGGWNVAYVKQPDGIIVIENPWSAQYTQQAFDEARKTYGLPIKALITSSDAWPHIAGIRQAVADGIPVYALDVNTPILTRMLASPHTMRPDDLQRHPRAPHFIVVGHRISVGSGPNRLEIIPCRTAFAERQLLVYFPERRLLYTDDLFGPDGNGGWASPELVYEALSVIQREHLTPTTIFGMHYDATPFSAIVAYIKQFAPRIVAPDTTPAQSAHALIGRAIDAMGGRASLLGIHSVDYVAVGERDMVEQSERPSGPYFVDHYHLHVTRDFAGHRARIERTDEAYAGPQWWLQQPDIKPQVQIINDDVSVVETARGPVYAGGYGLQESAEQSAFGPERLLLTADAATNLTLGKDVVLHGVKHHVLTFTWNGAPCTLYLSADTNLPWRIDYTRPYPYQTFLNVWGDVTTRVTFNQWNLEPGGIHYPREWSYERVNLPDTRMEILQLHFNPILDASKLTVAADLYNKYHGKPLMTVGQIPFGFRASAPPHELVPGIMENLGGWNVAFVKQSDGIIVIEAPWSPNYSRQAFDAARKAYGLPIKAVITTSDSWPHIAGVREAVAQGIPVYALDLNLPILKRLIAAPHTMRPDDLQLHPRAARFIPVGERMTIGTGANRLEIIPYRTATAERQMMVYFPEHHLLYTSDLFSDDGAGGWFTAEYLHEFIGVVDREQLTPQTIFGMHYDATPYQTIVDYLHHFISGGAGT